jgi:ParB family chromosome partitioning protein
VSKPQELPRRARGRGLNTLLPSRPQASSAAVASTVEDNVTHLRIDQIDPNPVQPRRLFQTEALEQLAQSIRLHGIIQPFWLATMVLATN